MAVDIKLLEQLYFTFDEDVPYKLEDGSEITITPIMLRQSETFLVSADLLKIDKNSMGSVDIIQMSYLEFLYQHIFSKDQTALYKFNIILTFCLKWPHWRIIRDNDTHKIGILNDETKAIISAQDFDDIRRIIMFQNILNYNDDYISPDLKKMMAEVDAVKNGNIQSPSLERKISIITAHSGLSKKDQLQMTMRAHQSLFEEVCGEVDFTTTRAIAMFAGKADEIGHWIFPKKKGKYDGYMVSMKNYSQSFGGKQSIVTQTEGDLSDIIANKIHK